MSASRLGPPSKLRLLFTGSMVEVHESQSDVSELKEPVCDGNQLAVLLGKMRMETGGDLDFDNEVRSVLLRGAAVHRVDVLREHTGVWRSSVGAIEDSEGCVPHA